MVSSLGRSEKKRRVLRRREDRRGTLPDGRNALKYEAMSVERSGEERRKAEMDS
jgi:hypothetical protein